MIRQAFNEPLLFAAEADARVAIQPFGKDEWMIQNYNDGESIVKLSTTKTGTVHDVLTGEELPIADGWLSIKLSPRGRAWIK